MDALYPALKLEIGHLEGIEMADLDPELKRAQDWLISEYGVLSPQIQVEAKADFGKNELRLLLDSREIAKFQCDEPIPSQPDQANHALNIAHRIYFTLTEHSAALVNPAVVELYLGRLESNYPEVARIAKTTLGVPAILATLMGKLTAEPRQSILNLPRILEEMLVESSPGNQA